MSSLPKDFEGGRETQAVPILWATSLCSCNNNEHNQRFLAGSFVSLSSITIRLSRDDGRQEHKEI